MDPVQLYTGKADKYQRSRWEYADQSIEAIVSHAGLDKKSAVADIGSGTGILGRQFIGKMGIVYLVEPNQDMRRALINEFNDNPACQIVAGRAEATCLAEQSIDLIAVGQALHWFDPQPTRMEFRRIIKPGGWLAVLRNNPTNEGFNEALAELFRKISQFMSLKIDYPESKPLSYYFKGGEYQTLSFDFKLGETRARFIDSLASAADAPDERDSIYPRFERLAGEVFDSFSQQSLLILKGVTELYLGRVA